MSSCSNSIKEYLFAQEQIKQNMKKIQNECPDKIINFVLSKESSSTIQNLINCSWSDFSDKKHIIKLIKKKIYIYIYIN